VSDGEPVWLPSQRTSRPLVILRNPEKWTKATPKQAAEQMAAQTKSRVGGKM
jgi:hypothetical protein